MLGWKKHKPESRLPGEISITSDMQMTPTLIAESEEAIKSLLMKVKEENEKVFRGSKITADGDCSHEIKRRLLLGRKVMTSLDSIFKSRDITLPTKVRLVKTMVFPCMDVRVGL